MDHQPPNQKENLPPAGLSKDFIQTQVLALRLIDPRKLFHSGATLKLVDKDEEMAKGTATAGEASRRKSTRLQATAANLEAVEDSQAVTSTPNKSIENEPADAEDAEDVDVIPSSSQAGLSPASKKRRDAANKKKRNAANKKAKKILSQAVVDDDETEEDELALDPQPRKKTVVEKGKGTAVAVPVVTPTNGKGMNKGKGTATATPAINNTPNTPGISIHEALTSFSIDSTQTQRTPFCYPELTQTNPSALWTAPDAATTLQIQAVILFSKELKQFAYPLPAATPALVSSSPYILHATKLVRVAVETVALLSNSRVKVAADNNNNAEKKKEWKPAGNGKGQYYVVAEKKKDRIARQGNTVPIWAEVVDLKGEKLRDGWELMVKARMEFACEEHEEERWVVNYWKARA